MYLNTKHMNFRDRNCDIRVAYSKGIKQTELAKKYKVSKQRIWQIIHESVYKKEKVKTYSDYVEQAYINKTQKTHIAFAKCKQCLETFSSKHGGDFQQCACGKSFIDQDRWDARYVRTGGDAEFIKQECPKGCKAHIK